ncbi:MAG: potassium channel family protein [Chloroflexota bacterium]|nr:potassium channel family protein [Chloroflexota bacterium]
MNSYPSQGKNKIKQTQSKILDVKRREDLLLRIERITELPLLALSFVMIPLLVGPFLWELSSGEDAIFAALDSFIWAVFAIDLIVKTSIAPHRRAFLRRHWLDVIIVLVPFIRPLRILRILLFGSRAFIGARRLVHVDFLVVYGLGLIILAATAITTVERNAEGAEIVSFPDALWWAVVTITTVGYGDTVPVTHAGRAVAYVLMLGGIAFFSGLVANLSALLVKGDHKDQESLDRLHQEMQKLREEITGLKLERERDQDTPPD